MFATASVTMTAANVEISRTTAENRVNPIGLGTTVPRFSWQTTSKKTGVVQTSYRIMVASTLEKLNKGEADLWDSGEQKSDEQLWIPYAGKTLRYAAEAYWKVCITTNKGKSEWSAPQRFTVGLLGECHWRGQWIGLEELQPGEQRGLHTQVAARLLRKEYKAKGTVKRATAYVAGIGLNEFYVNGVRLGASHVLQPVPSDYRKTIYYQTYDVTGFVKEGSNALAIELGNGRFFPMRQEKAYKSPVFGLPKCRINVMVEYADGKKETWATDNTWRITVDGPIRSNNEYDGETYDARKELGAWTLPDFDDAGWMKAQRCAVPDGTLTEQPVEGMVESLYGTPKSMKRRGGDTLIVDFGQNIAGWIGFDVRGKNGDTIRVKYAEKLKADGSLYLDNFRNALSEDIYVCNGKENGKEWRPKFSYHGFRYAAITGLKNAKATDFKAYTVSDEMRNVGRFESSDTILNKVMQNAWWGIQANYKGMPVDCPQRNERQPWLGDRTVGSLGESFLFDNERLYAKWMRDICEAQRSDGCIPDVAPAFWNYYTDNVTWPAALPFTCDMLYAQYGNSQPIKESYPSIKKWLSHIIDEYSDANGIITKDKYGDWCVPPEKLELIHSKDPKRQTDGSLISTAYVIRCLQLAEKFAKMQNLDTDASAWAQKRSELIEAFNKRFLTSKRNTSLRPGHALYPDSVYYGNNTSTANLLALSFGIAPDDVREEVAKNLVASILVDAKEHVNCGVIGISWLMRGLSDNGRSDVAYRLATQKTYPSWGYMAENGATTIWELWNGDKANPKMNSGNHVMLLGDLLTWCYQYLGGIRQTAESVAYKHIVLKPEFGIQNCEYVNVDYDTPYGTVKSHWKKTLQHLDWQVTVPCNTTADVCLPNGETKTVGSGDHHFSVEIPTSDRAIVKDEFLYSDMGKSGELSGFPSAHSATVTQLKNGDLVAAYFGGTYERNPDVCIYVNRKAKGDKEWSAPILAADGVFKLGTPEAANAGLAPLDTASTAADKGPIKDCKARFGIAANYNYDFRTKKANIKTAEDLKRKACWNPVLFTMPNGEVWLFYKVGLSVADWTGWLVKSKDGGKTWGTPEALPKGFLGPIKNKPILVGDRLICGSSTEGKGGWQFHVEILDLKTNQWKYVGPVAAEKALRTNEMPKGAKAILYVDSINSVTAEPDTLFKKMKPIQCIQPAILQHKDGRLQAVMRTRNARVATSFSSDGGDTWTPVTLLDIENNQSGLDAVTLKDGRHVLIYNDFETLPTTPKGVRTPLSLAISEDGVNWRHWLTLEDSPINQYSYPAIIQGTDGNLHCIYTWRRQRVAYKEVKP